MAWTSERIELLKKLWLEGYSASQVAAQLGGVTRSAVIGKLHRLGVTRAGSVRRAPNVNAVRTARVVREKVERKPRLVYVAPRDIGPLEPLGDTIDKAKYGQCLWIEGDPKQDGRICGRETGGHAYCEHHRAAAYVPTKKRETKRDHVNHYITQLVREQWLAWL